MPPLLQLFFLMAVAAILFLMEPSQKVITSSEIPRGAYMCRKNSLLKKKINPSTPHPR